MPPSEQWSPGTNPVELAADEIHVWRARLECSGQILRQFEATLAPDEIARADRFFFPRDRNSFVATRGLLRRLLANYLQSVPADIAIANHPRGKPFVAADSGKQLEFNVSHSHGMALLAFSMGRQLGVDVEFIRAEIASEEIAERFFA